MSMQIVQCMHTTQMNEETVSLFVLLTVNFVMHINCSVQNHGTCMHYTFKYATIYAMCLHLFTSFTEEHMYNS